MQKVTQFILILLFAFLAPLFALPVRAQSQTDNLQTRYFKGKVVDIQTNVEDNATTQKLQIEILEGSDHGKRFELTQTFSNEKAPAALVEKGETLVISEIISQGKPQYALYDRYRFPPLLFILAAFCVLVVLVAGKRGIGALIGLVISVVILLGYIVPQILNGADPLLITISGSLVIMVVTIFLAHGFSQQTLVAVGSTFLALILTGFLASGIIEILGLTGLGSEDAYMLQFNQVTINLKGLLLGGIIIGTLGVLDDVTTTQSATVYALAEANEKYTVPTLIRKGLTIGREHITSLVNTLVLAYAGASLPIFLFFVLNPLNQPVWLIINSEMITEEIVRTLTGSMGLILAVPITTIVAAFFSRYNVKIS